jgi:hypothetical protein
VKNLDRHQIDSLVRELECEAYGLALAAVTEPATAESAVVKAFERVAPYFARGMTIPELKQRLRARIRATAAASTREPRNDESGVSATVPQGLHLRIVDVVEEQQSTEPLGRRKLIVGVLAGLVALGMAGAVGWNRLDALAAAKPSVSEFSLTANAKDVPIRGDFRLSFARKPATKPTARLEPAGGTVDPVAWDGTSLVVSYSGLQFATGYTLVIEANYRSRFNDTGHYLQRWTFSTEGYPVVAKVMPADGQTIVFRNGEVEIVFNHRPPVDPSVTLTPADASTEPGTWIGSVWQIHYTGLLPLTRYQASVVLNFGAGRPTIRHNWSFVTEPGAPPSGLPVIWYGTTNPFASPDPQRVVALDWNGNLAGTLYGASIVRQSADGSMLAGDGGIYLNRQGTVVGRGRGGFAPTFADDGHTVCVLAAATPSAESGSLYLFTGPPEGAMRRGGVAGQFGPRSSVGLVACSVLSDRAILIDSGPAGITGLRVMAISSGRIVYQRAYSVGSTRTSDIKTSHDGRLLGELTSTNDYQQQTSVETTVIRRTTDGAILARLPGRRVVAFSWDGRRVVTAPGFGTTGPSEVDLVEWQTGKVLWRAAGIPDGNGGQPVFALARPDGAEMVVAVGTVPQTSDVDQLWLLDANGSARQLLNGTFYALFLW